MDILEFSSQAEGRFESSDRVEPQKLDDATFEPNTYIEQNLDYADAEAIQADFTGVMDSVIVQAQNEVASGADRVSGYEQGSATPIPLPKPGMDPDPIDLDDRVSSLPVPLPDPEVERNEEVSTLPVPLPDPEAEGNDDASVLPLPLPGPGTEGYDAASSLPLPLPGPEAGRNEEISAIPITIPDVKTGGNDEVSATPITLPDQKREGNDEISATPITLPGQNREENDDVSTFPKPIPEPGPEGQNQAADLPGPLPTPGAENPDQIGFKFFTKEPSGQDETPLPESSDQSNFKVEQGEVQAPLPGKTDARVEVTAETAAVDRMVENAMDSMQNQSQSFNLQYLQLQNNISQENRQFTMVSNIMKVKHDTAKNSINNIR
jgi:hypothetical protein